MLLVVFGAGASYDSDPDHPPRPGYSPPNIEYHRPPLANSLFDNRPQFLTAMQLFPECQPLIPRLRKEGVVVEQELAKIETEATEYPERHRQLTAIRYYLRSALLDCQNRWRGIHHGITNYATFLDEIERWRFQNNEQICFVTFNYDTMLEDSMAQVLHLQIRDMDSYRNWDNYSLFKLHGSLNWGRTIEGIKREIGAPSQFYSYLMKSPTPGRIALGVYQLCDPQMRPQPDRGGMLYPALSIPVQKKDEFSCPYDHIRALAAILPKVTKMITIGWRASEDEFLKMLLASRSALVPGIRQAVQLLVVTGSKEGAEQTITNLAPCGVNQDLLPNPNRARVLDGFTGLINNSETLEFFLRTGLY